MQKRRFFLNAIILMGSSFLLRVLHIGFRVFLAGRIGAAGMVAPIRMHSTISSAR